MRLVTLPQLRYTACMDPVTHLVSGALAGRALRKQFPTRLVYGLCILAAWLPDIDNFVGLGPEQYLLYHRGITHSVVGILFQALLITGVFRLFDKTFTPLKTFCVALGLLALHVWLDVITTYGTQLLAPFNATRFQWGSVFILDPFLTLTALVLFFVSLRSGDWGRRMAVVGLILFVAYPLGCRSVRNSVVSALPPLLAAQELGGRPFEVTTDVLSPIFWKIIVEDGDQLLLGSVIALPAAQDDIAFSAFTRADDALLDRLGEQASLFATWKWFSLWRTMEDVPVPPGQNGVRAITFSDLRFFSNAPPVRDFMTERAIPFQITAVLDENDKLLRFLYNHHSATIAYSVTN